MSALYPEDKFSIYENEVTWFTPYSWWRGVWSSSSAGGLNRRSPFWGKGYELRVGSNMTWDRIHMYPQEKSSRENLIEKYEENRNEYLTSLIQMKAKELLLDENSSSYLYVDRRPTLQNPYLYYSKSTGYDESGKVPDHLNPEKNPEIKDLSYRLTRDNIIRIWFIIPPELNVQTDELISIYEQKVSLLATALYTDLNINGSYEWRIVDKDGFFNDYDVQGEIAAVDRRDEKRPWRHMDFLDKFWWGSEARKKLENNEKLTEIEMDSLYGNMNFRYYKLNGLRKHIIAQGIIEQNENGNIRVGNVKKEWAAVPYSSYSRELQQIVQTVFGENAYGGFVNQDPEDEQQICVYVFAKSSGTETEVRKFVNEIVRLTSWKGTVDVFYLEEEKFWNNIELKRALKRAKMMEGKDDLKYWGVDDFLGTVLRDFFTSMIRKDFEETTDDERIRFYKQVVFTTDLDDMDAKIDSDLQAIYKHYRGLIKNNPPLDIIK